MHGHLVKKQIFNYTVKQFFWTSKESCMWLDGVIVAPTLSTVLFSLTLETPLDDSGIWTLKESCHNISKLMDRVCFSWQKLKVISYVFIIRLKALIRQVAEAISIIHRFKLCRVLQSTMQCVIYQDPGEVLA